MWLSLVERCVRDAKVAGSNPVTSTRYLKNRLSVVFFSVWTVFSFEFFLPENVLSGTDRDRLPVKFP